MIPVRSTPPYSYSICTPPTQHPIICHVHMHAAVGWRWLNLGSAGVAGLAFVYNILLPTPSLQKAGPNRKSAGVSNALCSAEFASHAWTAFNMGWSVLSLQLKPELAWMHPQAQVGPGASKLSKHNLWLSPIYAYIYIFEGRSTRISSSWYSPSSTLDLARGRSASVSHVDKCACMWATCSDVPA